MITNKQGVNHFVVDYHGEPALLNGDSGGALLHQRGDDYFLIGINAFMTHSDFKQYMGFPRKNHLPHFVELIKVDPYWMNIRMENSDFQQLSPLYSKKDYLNLIPNEFLYQAIDGQMQIKHYLEVLRVEEYIHRSIFVDLRSEENQKFLRKNSLLPPL